MGDRFFPAGVIFFCPFLVPTKEVFNEFIAHRGDQIQIGAGYILSQFGFAGFYIYHPGIYGIGIADSYYRSDNDEIRAQNLADFNGASVIDDAGLLKLLLGEGLAYLGTFYDKIILVAYQRSPDYFCHGLAEIILSSHAFKIQDGDRGLGFGAQV